MIYMGIDPGAKGGFTLLREEDTSCNLMNYAELVRTLESIYTHNLPVYCVLEKVHSMPQQGVKSTFNFGVAYGYIQGVLASFSIPYQEVPPQEWKKEFGLIKKDKKASIECAKKLFPKVNLLPTERSRVESDGMAESLLMAEYARRIYNGATKK